MKQNIEYRSITQQEMNRNLFSTFVRHQVVDKCRRKIDGQWTIISDPFVDEWSEDVYSDSTAPCARSFRTTLTEDKNHLHGNCTAA